MTLSTFSQITLTPEQRQRIKDLCTPENIIEWSKCVSNEERQKDKIISLQFKIDSLKSISTLVYEQHQLFIKQSDSINQVAKSETLKVEKFANEQKETLEKQLKKKGLEKWFVLGGVILTYVVIK